MIFQIFTRSLAWEVGHPQSNPKKYLWGKPCRFGDEDEEDSPLGRLGEARKFLVNFWPNIQVHTPPEVARFHYSALLFNPLGRRQHGRCQGLDGLIYVLGKEMERRGVMN